MQRKESDHSTTETPESFKLKMEGLSGAFKSDRVRWLVNRETEIEKNSNMSKESFNKLLAQTIREEAERSMITLELARRKEGTIGEIASSTKMPPKLILKHMIALMKRGSVSITGEKGNEYSFTALEPP